MVFYHRYGVVSTRKCADLKKTTWEIHVGENGGQSNCIIEIWNFLKLKKNNDTKTLIATSNILKVSNLCQIWSN